MDNGTDHQSMERHVLLFPFSAQGHVIPMLKLAKLLFKEDDLLLTFLTTEHIHTRLLHSSPEVFQSFSKSKRARFVNIPDGLPEDHPCQLLEVIESLGVNSRRSFKEVLDSFEGWPRVTCVIADGVLPLALHLPDEMGIPVMIFRTSSACIVLAYFSIPKLIECGEIPLSEHTDLDRLVQVVGGMEKFLRRRDLPSLIRTLKSTTEPTAQFMISISENLKKAKALILNTTEDLESTTLSHIRSNICSTTYTSMARRSSMHRMAQPTKAKISSVRKLRKHNGHVTGSITGVLAWACGQRVQILMGDPARYGARRWGARYGGWAGRKMLFGEVGPAGGGAGPSGRGLLLDPQRVELDSGRHAGWSADDMLAVYCGSANKQ